MSLYRYVLVASFALSGVAAVGCAGAIESDSDVGSTDDELQARATKFVGEFSWDPTSSFTDFEQLYLNENGSYQAQVNSALVNPSVKCVAFPCTLAEMGKWTTTKVGGQLKVSVSPTGGKPSRSYFASISDDVLSLTRFNKTTKLLKAEKETACVTSGCSGEICADSARFSSCIFRPEFACYKASTCERQADGECGWTITPSVKKCLAKAKP